MSLLVFNAGSTSLKFAVYDLATGVPSAVARGGIEPLDERAVLHLAQGADETRRPQPVDGIRPAVRACLELLAQTVFKEHPVTVLAHRLVYGEPGMGEFAHIDEPLLERLRKYVSLAPLHEQAEIDVIHACAGELGRELPAYAAFDTGFYCELPPAASTYAIPPGLGERFGIRRSGFHGFAHRSMLEGYCAAAGARPSQARIVSFQLGGGCSVTAIDRGRPVETSMGYTPLEGLVMATRSGDLDAGIIFECLRKGMAVDELYEILERDSGLKGLSGIGSDMRRLLAEAERGHAGAGLALDVYCHRARKYLGAYLAVLGGADAVVFGGGVGEHAGQIRTRICDGFEWCGLKLDEAANRRPVSRPQCISAPQSKIGVYVVPVDEESVIAREVLRVSRGGVAAAQS
ncbi:MAG: acetate/propionate family kinase [Nevskia sp.]|nr:acetate/propionate family kinase [Nevskia sp.]